MATSNSDGSETAVISTEVTIGGTGNDTITTAGSFVLMLDTNAMALGDELIVRAKVRVRSTGTTRLAYTATYGHVQGSPVKLSIPIASTNVLDFTIEQTAGTGRAYPWEIVEL